MHDKPEFIVKEYRSWAFDEPKNVVVVPYVTMHGSTRRMVGFSVAALTQGGVMLKQSDLVVTDVGKLATGEQFSMAGYFSAPITTNEPCP